jgi:cytochrome oxidase Cu insertion factor (SCO1/SenC/PrrC family)
MNGSPPPAETAGYSISHSSHIYLIDTIGRVRATFGEGVPVGRITESVHRLAVAPIEVGGGEA